MSDLSAEDWTQVQNVFDELVALPTAGRANWLKRRQVSARIATEALSLAQAADSDGILDRRTSPAPTEPVYSSLQSGTLIGPFKIDHLVGRGGAGEVYRAHRTGSDFEQIVAIKLLRPEALERIAAFDVERRLLSNFDHPGIARLIDGGVSADGRPFMAMEFVDGTDIVSWCTEQSLDLATRLALFDQVCDAVSYAHRRLVVHRDIKPSNIMIDREGRVRLLDFGVARLLEAATEGQTGTLVILTPEYAAPEQMENRPPTTSVDVYSLGAVLFEMLTGHSAWRFDETSMPAVIRRLLHEDPPVPSRVAPMATASGLSGDLDAIILKAMRRAPAERYENVAALAEDLKRHRSSQPVRARAGTSLYLTQRFVRRHRWGVAATAASVVALLVGTGGVAWQARAVAVERDIARAEAARSEAVNQSVSLMFRNASERGLVESVTARDLLDSTAARLLSGINPDDPDDAAVVLALAQLYGDIEDPAALEALVERALAAGVGRSDPVILANLKLNLGSAKAVTGDTEAARRLLAEADSVWRTNPRRYRVELQEAVAAEARMRRAEGDTDGGIRLLTDNMQQMKATYPHGSREYLTRYNNLAVHLIGVNRLDEAQALIDEAEIAARESNVLRTSIGLSLLQTRANIAAATADFPEASRVFKQAVDLRRELYGPSGGLAADLLNYGRVTMVQGDPGAALRAFEEAQPLAMQYLGSDTFVTLMIVISRVDALCALQRPDEADELLPEVERGATKAGPNTLQMGLFHRTRAYVRLSQGRMAEARNDLGTAEGIYRALGPSGTQAMTDVTTLKSRLG